MPALFTNNATTTLSAGISSVATSISVAAATGALFPTITGSDYFYVTLVNAANQIEIVKCTARASDTFTVVRGQEGTVARAYLSGDRFELRPTAAALTQFLSKEGGTTTGAVTTNGALTVAGTFTIPAAVTMAAGTTAFNVGTANFAVGLQVAGVPVVSTTGSQTLTNKTLTNPVIANIMNTGLIALPNGPTTLVATDVSQTLTVKTLSTGCLLTGDVTVNDAGAITAASPGFRGLPANPKTGTYTLALSDAGKHISITAGGVVIPDNAAVAFPVGTAITVYNDSAATQTISITTDTLRHAGTVNTGTRTIAVRGLVTVIKVAATEWVASGNIS